MFDISELKKDNLLILERCIKHNKPELMWILQKPYLVINDTTLLDDLIDIVSDELINEGLNKDDTLNELGYKLESLIDIINKSSLDYYS